MNTKPRILVIGAGPAGLGAAARLLERSGSNIELTVMHGAEPGKEEYEPGGQRVVGFYHNLKGLMKRAGIDLDTTLLDMGSAGHMLDPVSKQLHTIDGASAFDVAKQSVTLPTLGITERQNLDRIMSEAYLLTLRGTDALKACDEQSFSAWCMERGMLPQMAHNLPILRLFRDAYFNYPGGISAYHLLQSCRLMGGLSLENAKQSALPADATSTIWNPITAYVRRMGGTFLPYSNATDWHYEGHHITGVEVTRTDPAGHPLAMARPHRAIPLQDTGRRIYRDFDYVLSALPVAAFCNMNRGQQAWWESGFFNRLAHLPSATSISMTVITRKPVGQFQGPVFGLPAPLGSCTNMTPYWRRYRDDPEVGAVLVFSGQTRGYEHWSDDDITNFTLDNFSAVNGFGNIRDADILQLRMQRNVAEHLRQFDCEPGVQTFRPGNRTPFHNLFLAGDWVRNAVDVVCTEGAITSGQEAADQLLRHMNSYDHARFQRSVSV
ncbi:FAD-dependent oxidoreductase [Ketobacter sp.]|uniref:FAD-dependent oxidoreductase n=1 Tax=Ketobacter sp. TaxID=2083498 RepID=UPI0025C3248D|nr:FAD-dependent oxidoreductase [Ketobacter sp.]